MKAKSYRTKRQFINKENNLKKKHYATIIILGIFGYIYYNFISPKTIGHDTRYTIFVFGLPVTIGILFFGIYRRQYLLHTFATNKGFFLRTFLVLFYLLQGVIFSYLSFGQVAQVCWDMANKQAATHNRKERFVLEVTRFWTKQKPYSIDYTFQGRHEKINVDYQTLKEYKDESPKDYQIVIEAQEGLWNHYLITDWTLEKKVPATNGAGSFSAYKR